MHCADCVSCGDQLAALILLAHEPEEFVRPVASAPKAQVIRGGFGRSKLGRRGAVAAAVGVALVAFGLSRPTLDGAADLGTDEPSLRPYEPSAEPSEVDGYLIDGDVGWFLQLHGDGAQVDAGGRSALEDVKAGVRALAAGNHEQAIATLRRFGPGGEWDVDGTAMLGYALYLDRNADAFQVFESYVADAEIPMPPTDQDHRWDTVFFILARELHARGDVEGAHELVDYTQPLAEVGKIARTWREVAIGDS